MFFKRIILLLVNAITKLYSTIELKQRDQQINTDWVLGERKYDLAFFSSEFRNRFSAKMQFCDFNCMWLSLRRFFLLLFTHLAQPMSYRKIKMAYHKANGTPPMFEIIRVLNKQEKGLELRYTDRQVAKYHRDNARNPEYIRELEDAKDMLVNTRRVNNFRPLMPLRPSNQDRSRSPINRRSNIGQSQKHSLPETPKNGRKSLPRTNTNGATSTATSNTEQPQQYQLQQKSSSQTPRNSRKSLMRTSPNGTTATSTVTSNTEQQQYQQQQEQWFSDTFRNGLLTPSPTHDYDHSTSYDNELNQTSMWNINSGQCDGVVNELEELADAFHMAGAYATEDTQLPYGCDQRPPTPINRDDHIVHSNEDAWDPNASQTNACVTSTCAEASVKVETPPPDDRPAWPYVMSTLENTDNSCYMNSVLYVLRMTPKFLHYLHHLTVNMCCIADELDAKAVSELKDDDCVQMIATHLMLPNLDKWANQVNFTTEQHGLISEMHKLFAAMTKMELKRDNDPLMKGGLQKIVRDLNPIFTPKTQQDAQEFLGTVLNCLRDVGQCLMKMAKERASLFEA